MKLQEGYAGLFLRIGLSLLFFYFGLDKFLNLESNVFTGQNMLLVNLAPFSTSIVLVMAGVIEVVIGILLLLGVYNKVVAIGAAAWVFIIFLQTGYPGGIYDLGLSIMALALYFTGSGKYSLDSARQSRNL